MSTLDKQLARFISRYAEFKLAILFGSQATGNVTGDSDIDLALLSDAPISSSKKLQLVEQIGARFGRPVDIAKTAKTATPTSHRISYKTQRSFALLTVKGPV